MPRWAVIFQDDPGMLEIRADQARRDAHVAFARAHPQLRIGGGLTPSPDAPFCGALWVVDAETRAEVDRLVQADPFFDPALRRYEIYTWGKILEDQTVTL